MSWSQTTKAPDGMTLSLLFLSACCSPNIGFRKVLETTALVIGLRMLATGTYRVTVTGERLCHYGQVRICKRCVSVYCSRLFYKHRQIICVGSVQELEELSGVKGITDLHRDKIDHITIPSKEGRGDLKRIEEIFDCWFESGRYEGYTLNDVDLLNYMPACHTPNFTILSKTRSCSSVPTPLTSSPRVLTRLAAGSIPYSFFQHISSEGHLGRISS